MSNSGTNKSIPIKIKTTAAILISVTAIVGISIFTVLNAKKEVLEYSSYQYFNDQKFNYAAGTKLELEENNVILKSDKTIASADTSPIYYNDEEMIVTTRNMSYVNPKTGDERYVPICTTLYKNEEEQICIRKGRKELVLDGGFLFDGQDTYVFLDEVVINYAGRKYEAAPFSFAVVTADGDTRTYLYGTQEYNLDNISSDSIFALEEYYGYQVNMKYDTMKMTTGDDKLLFVTPSLLDPIE